MKLFFCVYALCTVSVAALIYFLSLNETKIPRAKTGLTITYILSLIGIFLSMAVMEGHFKISMLVSSVIAALTLGALYLADTVAGNIRKRNEFDK